MEQAVDHVSPLDLDANRCTANGSLEKRLAELPVAKNAGDLSAVINFVSAVDWSHCYLMPLLADGYDPIVLHFAFVAGHLAADRGRPIHIAAVDGRGDHDELGRISVHDIGRMKSARKLLSDH